MQKVVITGLGAITPIGNSVQAFWDALEKGTSGANLISRFDAEGFSTRFACEVKDYDAAEHFDRKEMRKIDRYSQFGLVAAKEAIADAGLSAGNIPEDRIGVIMASGIGGFETFETLTEEMQLRGGVPRPSPFFITKIIANGLAGEISIRYGFHGVNYAPVSACASSAQAIIHAYNYIRMGKADAILAGGSEAPITRASISGFSSIKALSTNNDNYRTASRPFDQDRDGFVLGEGAGAMVIESLDSARRRGAKIYAEIIGSGEKSDAYHITATHPDGLGARLAMEETLAEAGLHPNEVEHINVHATSTGMGDPSEVKALNTVFGGREATLYITATKSMTGHLLGAAGVVEAMATILPLYKSIIPPTINTVKSDLEIPAWMDLDLGGAVSREIRVALSNSFGFGGHCACIAFRKWEE